MTLQQTLIELSLPLSAWSMTTKHNKATDTDTDTEARRAERPRQCCRANYMTKKRADRLSTHTNEMIDTEAQDKYYQARKLHAGLINLKVSSLMHYKAHNQATGRPKAAA